MGVTSMVNLNINDIINSTQIAAAISLVATVLIILLLRPKSHKEKHAHR
jgi:hypothetical protein